MFQRFFAISFVKVIIWIETAISIIIFTNLWTLVDKYYIGKQAESKGLDYNYVVSFDVHLNMVGYEYQEGKMTVRQQISDFIDDLCSLDGNVSIYPIAGNIGGGDKVLYTVYISANESLPVAIEGKSEDFCSNAGVYVGNYNINYINDNTISMFSDRADVIGIMASYGFEKNEFIYVKYNELSDISRKEVIEYLLENVYNYSDLYIDGNPFSVRAESNLITEEIYRQSFGNIIDKYSVLTYRDGNTGAVEPAVSYARVYQNIKYVFLGLSVFMCAGLLFQTMQLYLYNEKDNILIKKIYGMKERQIFLPICAQILIIFVLAIFLAMLVEVIVYHFIERCNLLFIMKGLAAAAAVSAVLELIVLAAAYLKFRLTGMSLVSRLSGAEE